jgi:dihydrofolate reductase
MRRVINSTYMTIDGVIEAPQDWTFGYRSDDAAQYAHDLLFSADTVIMGRRTYEAFADVWPNLEDDTGMADRMNGMTKLVASGTLADPAWNNTTVIPVQDFPDLVRDLKTREGEHIVQYGFGPLTAALMGEGLVDELRIWMHPLFAGNSEPNNLISHHAPETKFGLVDVRQFGSGVVVLRYEPA